MVAIIVMKYIDIKDIISNINENYGELDLNSIGYVSNNKNISNVKEDFLDLYEKYSKSRKGLKTQIAAQFDIEYSTLYRRISRLCKKSLNFCETSL